MAAAAAAGRARAQASAVVASADGDKKKRSTWPMFLWRDRESSGAHDSTARRGGLTGLLLVCAWMHGATVGVAIGDREHLVRFLWITSAVFVPVIVAWPHNRVKRLAAAFSFLVLCSFLMALVKAVAFDIKPTGASMAGAAAEAIAARNSIRAIKSRHKRLA